MKPGSRHLDLLPPLLGQVVVFGLASALFTVTVAVGYGAIASLWQGGAPAISEFEPSAYAWQAAVLAAVMLALFNTTGDSVELDCDQGRKYHSAMTYGLALATTGLFALLLERMSHGTWLQPYFRSALGATVVVAFMVTKLVALRWHRKTLLSHPTQ